MLQKDLVKENKDFYLYPLKITIQVEKHTTLQSYQTTLLLERCPEEQGTMTTLGPLEMKIKKTNNYSHSQITCHKKYLRQKQFKWSNVF